MSLDWLGPSVTLVLGVAAFFAGGAGERRRDQRLSAREQAAREQAARERRDDERHRFQLENYLALQDALREYMRASAKIIWADKAIVKEHGHFTMLPEGLSQDAFDTGIVFGRLMNRVVDDELRDQLEKFNSIAAQTTTPPLDNTISKERATALIDDRNEVLTDVYQKTAAMVGDRLRRELKR
jgi:hypothetical protein